MFLFRARIFLLQFSNLQLWDAQNNDDQERRKMIRACEELIRMPQQPADHPLGPQLVPIAIEWNANSNLPTRTAELIKSRSPIRGSDPHR